MSMMCCSGKFPLEEDDRENARLFLFSFHVLILLLLRFQASMEQFSTFRILLFEISENRTILMISFWFA